MTASEIYTRALALNFEDGYEDPIFASKACTLIELLLTEALETENSIRRDSGREELKSVKVESLESEIPFDTELLVSALPYGLCAYFLADEGDNYKAQDYRGRFLDALDRLSKYRIVQVQDEY